MVRNEELITALLRKGAGGTHGKERIENWKDFATQVRSRGCKLLTELHRYPDAVLVTGCQRSGTTALARVIMSSEGMVSHWVKRDDELDGALILSGSVEHVPEGRYCFQTTYLNECYREYFERARGHKIVWVLRNPISVVYSIVYNWKRFARNELFAACGYPLLGRGEKLLYDGIGAFAISRLRNGCLSYNGKVSQLFTIIEWIARDDLMVVEYDQLVQDRDRMLRRIYDFIGLPYNPVYAAGIRSGSVRKADRLSRRKQQYIERICMPVYERASRLLTPE